MDGHDDEPDGPAWVPRPSTAPPTPPIDAIEALEVPEPKPWPTLGPEARYGRAGDVVGMLEPETESDPVAILVHFVAAVGNAVGRGAYATVEADRHHANLFVAVVGSNSVARKATNWGRVRQVMEQAFPDWSVVCVVQGLTSAEGLIHRVRDGEGKDEGGSDKRLMVEESEFACVLKRMAQKENTLSAVIRQAWQTGDLRTLRKLCPVKATGAHVSIVGHITEAELGRYMSDTDTLNGFSNRFLWVCARPSKDLPVAAAR